MKVRKFALGFVLVFVSAPIIIKSSSYVKATTINNVKSVGYCVDTVAGDIGKNITGVTVLNANYIDKIEVTRDTYSKKDRNFFNAF